MPSLILGNSSGGQNILSGGWWSGVARLGNPSIGGIQLRLDKTSSGNAYVGFSGNLTVQSGPCRGGASSGDPRSGLLDGMIIYPGDPYFIPKIAMGLSGTPQLFMATDAAASGQARLYWELY